MTNLTGLIRAVVNQYIRADFDTTLSGFLEDLLGFCRRNTMSAVSASNKMDFIKVLEKRMEDFSGSGLAHVKKVIKQAQTK